ncbi:MAG TPA: NTP transferase domain-containing protein, partial [Myxococcota bacterium]
MSTESAAPAAPIEAAIILAAGRGNRISSMSSTPKPLLSMSGAPGGPSFLDFHLRHLAAHGVKDVVIVGNSVTARAPLRAILQLAGKVKVQIVENPTEDLTTSGSGHSLWFALQAARHLFDGQRRVLFMDADIAYDDDIFARLAAADPRRSATLVAPRTAADSEEVVVWADPEARHNAVRHGKGLWNTPLVEGLVPVGEATGVVMVAPADHERFLGLTDWAMKSSTAKTRSEHEDLTQLLMGLDRVDVVSLDVATAFMEVDTPADY